MAAKIEERMRLLARDQNLDIEDVTTALAGESPDKPTLTALRDRYSDILEPAAKRYLTDVIDGKSPTPPNRQLLAKGGASDVAYARSDVLRLQDALTALGIPTRSDGNFGSGTAESVSGFQKSANLPETGRLDARTLLAMNVALSAAGKKLLDLSPRARVRPDSVITVKNGGSEAANRTLAGALNELRQKGVLSGSARTDGTFDEATEQLVRELQAKAYLPETGVLDISTRDALNQALVRTGAKEVSLEPPSGGAGFKGKVELHFYPGDEELKLYVIRNGKVLDVYGMVGGEREGHADTVHNNGINYSPSPKGGFDLLEPATMISWSWPYSRVPYGAELRDVRGEVQYRDKDGQWHFATGPQGEFRGARDTLSAGDYREQGELLDFWPSNDFGHISARLRSQRTGDVIGSIIHSSGSNETTEEYFKETESLTDPTTALDRLGHSHGCEHIHPRDMDELVTKGYLGADTVLRIHGYDEKFKP